jgi:hypothetical protein
MPEEGGKVGVWRRVGGEGGEQFQRQVPHHRLYLHLARTLYTAQRDILTKYWQV